MPSQFVKFKDTVGAFKQNADSGLLLKFQIGCGSLANTLKRSKEIHQQVGQRLIPDIKRMLDANYQSSGVGKATARRKWEYKPTGKLYNAAVKNAKITVTNGYISIEFGTSDDKICRYGASINFGSVRVPQVYGAVRDIVTGRHIMRGGKLEYKHAAIGERAKRSIKKARLAGALVLSKRSRNAIQRDYKTKLAGVVRAGFDPHSAKVVTPKPFFFLSDDQRTQLAAKYIELWQQEVNKIIGISGTKKAA